MIQHPVSNSPSRSSPAGRPRATTRAEVAHVALELFARRGYDATTVDDVAAAVGVSRRTLFRYYASKPDLVWGDFDVVLDALRAQLAAAAADESWLEALQRAIVASNRYDPAELPTLRIRMRLITSVPALQAHALVRYAEWRAIVSGFVALRRGERRGDLLPRLVGSATLGATMGAFEWWVEHGGDPADAVERALALMAAGFATP
jgi:mycofactocin system transcriptional regulator